MSIPIEGHEETCSNCRFFLDYENERLGMCRRYPPTLAPPLRSPHDEAWIRPVTAVDDWCGEHQVNTP